MGLAFGSETVSIATSLTSQGYLTLFGTTLSATSVDMQSGTLVGGGTIEGSLTNNGYVLPTNGETLTVTGDYTQTSGGELSVNFATTYPPGARRQIERHTVRHPERGRQPQETPGEGLDLHRHDVRLAQRRVYELHGRGGRHGELHQ